MDQLCIAMHCISNAQGRAEPRAPAEARYWQLLFSHFNSTIALVMTMPAQVPMKETRSLESLQQQFTASEAPQTRMNVRHDTFQSILFHHCSRRSYETRSQLLLVQRDVPNEKSTAMSMCRAKSGDMADGETSCLPQSLVGRTAML